MIYAPLGYLWPRGVIDPFWWTQEWYEVSRVWRRTTQYQWQESSFLITEYTMLKRGAGVVIQEADDPLAQDIHYDMDMANTAPNLGQHADIWDIPYNTSFTEVPNTQVTWDSSYPELVLCAFSFQYVRKGDQTGEPLADFNIRAKTKISVDGVHQPGSGGYAYNIDGSHRGSGITQQAGRFTSVCIVQLPAGSHSVQAVAVQGYGGIEPAENQVPETVLLGSPPATDQVCIGSRKMILVRFPKGRWIGA